MASFMNATSAEQAAMLQEINSLEKLRNLHQSLRSEKARLIALTASLGTTNAQTTAKINALSSSLQLTEKRYGDLYKAQKSISKESSGFETTMKSFQGLFGAGSNSVTNSIRHYANAVGEAAFKTREFTDVTGQVQRETTMFGHTLGGNAAQVQKWTQTALVVASAAGAIADKVNDASIAQGKLSGLYGAKALSSAGEYYRLIGAGLESGGEMGKAAVMQTTEQLMTGRRGYKNMLFNSDGTAQAGKVDRLVNIAASGFPIGDWIAQAQNVMGEPDGVKVIKQAERISAEAKYVNIPSAMYGKMIMDLASQFVSLGMTLDQAHESVKGFADAISTGTLSPAMASTMLNMAGQQQMTGAGVPMTLQNAAWIQQNFDQLPEDLQKKLAGITGVDVMTAGGMISELNQKDYARAMSFGGLGFLGELSGAGLNSQQARLIQRYLAPQATGAELLQMEGIRRAEYGAPYEGYDASRTLAGLETAGPVLKRDKTTGMTRILTAEEAMVEDFSTTMRSAAEDQKRWFAFFQIEWNNFLAALTESVKGESTRSTRVSFHPGEFFQNLFENTVFPTGNDTLSIPTSSGTVNIKVSVDDKNAVPTKKGAQTKK